MTSGPQESVPETALREATWGDHLGFRIWIGCFLLIALHCLLNILGGLWGR